MTICWRNHEKTYTACPVLVDAAVSVYLRSGELPAGTHHLEVPPTKIIRNRGFWLRPSYRCHTDATVFLISTDVYEMNADDLEAIRSQVFCYSSAAENHYIGRIGSEGEGLVPLIGDLHDPFPLKSLRYCGRVIAAQ